MKMKSIKLMVAGLLVVPILALVMNLTTPLTTSVGATCDTSALNLRGGADCTGQSGTLFGTGGKFTLVTNIALYLIGAISVIMIIYGGIRYTISGGDSTAVTNAKNTILYAVVGLVVAVLAYAIVNFVLTNMGV